MQHPHSRQLGAHGLLLALLVALLFTCCSSTTSSALLNRASRSVASKARNAGIKATSTAVTAGIKASQAVVKVSSSTKRVSQRSWEAAKAATQAARAAGSLGASHTTAKLQQPQAELKEAAQLCTEVAFPGSTGGAGGGGGGACSGQDTIAEAAAAPACAPAAAGAKGRSGTQQPPLNTPDQPSAPPPPSAAAAATQSDKAGLSWWLVGSHLLAVALGWWLRGEDRPQQHQQQQDRQTPQHADTPPLQRQAQQRQQQQQQQQRQQQQRRQSRCRQRGQQRPSDAESQAGSSGTHLDEQHQQQARHAAGGAEAPRAAAAAAAAAPAGEQEHAAVGGINAQQRNRTSWGSIGSIGSEQHGGAAAAAEGDAERVQQEADKEGPEGSSEVALSSDGGGMSRTGSSDKGAGAAAAAAAAAAVTDPDDEPPAAAAGDRAAPGAASEDAGAEDNSGGEGDPLLQPALAAQATGSNTAQDTQLVRMLQQAQLQQVPGQQPVLVVQQVNHYNTVHVGGREVARLLQPVIKPLGEAMDTLKHLAAIGRHWVDRVSQEQAAQQLAAQQALVGRAAACGQTLTLVVMGYTALHAGRVWELHMACRGSVHQPSWWNPARLVPGSSSVAGGLMYINCVTQQLGLYAVGAALLAVFVRISSGLPSVGFLSSGTSSPGRPSQMYQLDLVVVKGLLLSWLGAHTVHCLGGAWLPWLGCWLAWCGCQLWLNIRHVSTLLSHVLVVVVAFALPVVASGWAFSTQALVVQGWLLEHVPALRWLHAVAHWRLWPQ